LAFFFRRGNRILGPWRLPVLEACQFFRPVTASAIPFAYASLLFSAHHEPVVSPVSRSSVRVACSLARFQRFRRLYADHTELSYSPVSRPVLKDSLIVVTAQLYANRRAPQSRRNLASCSGVGSRATVQPRTVIPVGAWYLGISGFHRG
jgi:hypothetical protein